MPAGSGQSEGTEVRSLSVQTAILDIGSARGTIFVPLVHRQYEADDAETKTAAAKKINIRKIMTWETGAGEGI